MRRHDAKSPTDRQKAWGEGYWAYEKKTHRFGSKRNRHSYLPIIPIVKDEDGRLRPAEY